MKMNMSTERKYLEIEIPYKLNVLYSFIYWREISQIFGGGILMDSLNSQAIYCSVYESSILFGRHVLSFWGIGISNGKLARANKWKGRDIDVTDVLTAHELIDLEEELLIKNSGPIKYLLTIANKRVAHATWNSEELGKTNVDLIINAQEVIHELVEMYVPELNKELLLKYNGYASMTT